MRRTSLIGAMVGGRDARRLRRYERRLAQIERVAGGLARCSDDELRQRAAALRERGRDGEPSDALLPEAFALGREVAGRVLGMRHFDVQLLGAMALHDGLVAEMKTGEGKTLVATLPAYLEALGGRAVHVVTVNDYLAQRDAEWMGPLYGFFGLSVGVIVEQMGDDRDEETAARRAAYACDVTYGTNHEIAFDYLRDNLAITPEEIVHRAFDYAIVDEVDFLLIDEARTPLIISAPAREELGLFGRVDRVVRRLQPSLHFAADPRGKRASLTDRGLQQVQQALGVDSLVDPENLLLYHAVCQSVLAHAVYRRDVDYIVDGGRVFIVDEHTGRVSEDKRFSDGLHQALEAKEGVKVKAEDQTVAKVTYQTFFGRYRKLAGMTGTAWSEREELRETYRLDVQRIPTHKEMIRQDFEDLVFASRWDKHGAIVAEIGELTAEGRPVLVGSTSVAESEALSRRLQQAGIAHQVLNAKNHRAEAQLIAGAGRRAAVTISTNMAGRGTDIILGGGDAGAQREVVAAGGLHVIGTARHESVRIDDQLRGRSGRQGDPGSSQFFVALEDEIWQRFGAGEITALRAELAEEGHPADEPLPATRVAALLRRLQHLVEEENRAIRREVLKYDLVVHAHREWLYAWRRTLVGGEGYDAGAVLADLLEDLAAVAEPGSEREALEQALGALLQQEQTLPAGAVEDELLDAGFARLAEAMEAQRQRFGAEIYDELCREILLQSIDDLWTDHLSNLERLEEGIGLRGYAQVDPLVEWRREAGLLYNELRRQIRWRAVALWLAVEPG